MSAIFEVIN